MAIELSFWYVSPMHALWFEAVLHPSAAPRFGADGTVVILLRYRHRSAVASAVSEFSIVSHILYTR